jgi:hypothetical protein
MNIVAVAPGMMLPSAAAVRTISSASSSNVHSRCRKTSADHGFSLLPFQKHNGVPFFLPACLCRIFRARAFRARLTSSRKAGRRFLRNDATFTGASLEGCVCFAESIDNHQSFLQPALSPPPPRSLTCFLASSAVLSLRVLNHLSQCLYKPYSKLVA